MARRPEIDPHEKPAVMISIRFASDIVQMLDLLTDNRSEYVRNATYEKIKKEMENGE